MYARSNKIIFIFNLGNINNRFYLIIDNLI